MITSLLTLLSLDSLHNETPELKVKEHLTVELPANPYPIKKPDKIAPILQAESIYSLDLETGQVLYSKNAHQQLPIASLTKLLTAAVILDEHQLDEIVTVNFEATKIEPAKLYLLENEKITVKELLRGLLIKSANDAALALAYYNSGSVPEFAKKMNAKAKELGMYSSNFVNPTGFDEEGQFSTAHDMSIISRYILKNQFIQNTVITQETEIKSIDGNQVHKIASTNNLLSSYLKVLGLKTGTTDLAGECLITVIENDSGQKILNIMLDSPSRFEESKILSEWIFQSYLWI
ncbi:hypothetical protein GF376_03050 [Candidatus Peregrinibacteria bacterium]|nr:hypothetical protein [Candidatus Peregrinibacteria bacterium]